MCIKLNFIYAVILSASIYFKKIYVNNVNVQPKFNNARANI